MWAVRCMLCCALPGGLCVESCCQPWLRCAHHKLMSTCTRNLNYILRSNKVQGTMGGQVHAVLRAARAAVRGELLSAVAQVCPLTADSQMHQEQCPCLGAVRAAWAARCTQCCALPGALCVESCYQLWPRCAFCELRH